jgi:hypothetical protein
MPVWFVRLLIGGGMTCLVRARESGAPRVTADHLQTLARRRSWTAEPPADRGLGRPGTKRGAGAGTRK